MIGIYCINVMNNFLETFHKKALLTQRLGIFGKNITNISYQKIY